MITNTRQTSFLTRAALTLLLFFVCTVSARSTVYFECSLTLSSGQKSAECLGGSVSSNGAQVTVSPRMGFSVVSVFWSYPTSDGQEVGRPLSENPATGSYNAGGAYGTVLVTFQTEIKNVQVSFETGSYGGEAPATQNLTIGEKVTKPADPTAENYEFLGWYWDAGCTTPFDFDVALSYTTPYSSYTDSNASESPHYNLVLYAKGRAYVEGYCGKVDDTHDGTQLTWSGYKNLPTETDVIDILIISGNGEMADEAFSWWKLNTVIINEGVTTIGQGAFYGCSGLSSVTIPSSVTSIGYDAFRSCTSLSSVTICSGVTTIGQNAFENCTSLSSVTIPSSVTSIGQSAFEDCTSLSSITIYAPPLATYDNRAFYLNASDRKIYVYSDFVDDYKAGWPNYANDIEAIPNATISALSLADNTDNTSAIAGSDGKLADVTLEGRTLYKDGKWNTLCLPFALNATRTAELLENPEALMTLKSTSFEGGTLTLTFEDATAIEAGKPYIVKWTRAADYTDDNTHNLYAPTFPYVPITQSTASIKTQYIDFVGSYSPVSLEANDNTVLYLGADNTLYYPSAAMTIGSCRAYFQLKGDLTAADPTSGDSGPQTIRAFVLNFGEETGLETVNGSGLMVHGSGWFTLDGRRLSGQPTQRGIYLHNGRKLLIK